MEGPLFRSRIKDSAGTACGVLLTGDGVGGGPPSGALGQIHCADRLIAGQVHRVKGIRSAIAHQQGGGPPRIQGEGRPRGAALEIRCRVCPGGISGGAEVAVRILDLNGQILLPPPLEERQGENGRTVGLGRQVRLRPGPPLLGRGPGCHGGTQVQHPAGSRQAGEAVQLLDGG